MDILTSYEFVVSEGAFFISVNGQVLPSACDGFSVNKDNCLIFRLVDGDIVGYPIPDAFMELIGMSECVLFVKYVEGVIVNACNLMKLPV